MSAEAWYMDAITRARPRLGSLASSFHWFPTIGSTNDEAIRIGTEGAVVVAEEQTAGRGRRGHTWFSPPGSGLYVSVVLAPTRVPSPAHARRGDDVARRATMLLTVAAGLAISEGIEAATGLRTDLKWPNDIHVGGRKVCGILAEAATDAKATAAAPAVRHVIVGYGINVNVMAYPPELRDRATSLESELGREIERSHVLAETLAALARRYDDLIAGRFDAILDAWRRRAPGVNGARVSWTTPAGTHTGITAGIDGDGALLVQTADRVDRIVAGEVTWL